jgi:hypothetical protein
MNSESELIEALKALPPLPTPEIEYRLYYDVDGNITGGTTMNHHNNTQYLVVSKIEYDNYYRYKIIDNKLKIIDNTSKYRVQLTSSTQGYAVVKNHASLVLEPNEKYTDIEYYAAC